MKRFKAYIAEEIGFTGGKTKNSHMKHLEDEVLDGGVQGARSAIIALRSFRDMLQGNGGQGIKISTKWDGAPAVFAGIDPTDGKFFVAKKGIFNKNPKVYKNHADIDADTKGDLNTKLKKAFDNLKNVGITGVIQGDFMFDKSDLKVKKIEGEKNVTFHPNTIVYAAPVGSELANKVQKAEIGIVWHTRYNGGTFETMTPEYGATITPKLKSTSKVWMVDATMDGVQGATLTEAETKKVNSILSQAGKVFNKIASSTLKELETNKELNLLFNTFNNTKVRAKTHITNPKKHTAELIEWINVRFTKEEDKRKSDKGKQGVRDKRDNVLSFFDKKNRKNIEAVFELQKLIVDAKSIIINKLNELNSMPTFVLTKKGYKVTNPEGYVAIDKVDGGAVKLVDRLEFSTLNFDPDIIKGWEHGA